MRQRKVRKIQEERRWESSEAKEDVTALRLLQWSASADQERADSASQESENDSDAE